MVLFVTYPSLHIIHGFTSPNFQRVYKSFFNTTQEITAHKQKEQRSGPQNLQNKGRTSTRTAQCTFGNSSNAA